LLQEIYKGKPYSKQLTNAYSGSHGCAFVVSNLQLINFGLDAYRYRDPPKSRMGLKLLDLLRSRNNVIQGKNECDSKPEVISPIQLSN
jgi:hypothetical protein